MKKYMYVLLIVCIGAMSAWADTDSGEKGNDKIQDTTSQMVEAGITSDTAERMTRMMEEKHFTQAAIVSAQKMVIAAAKEGLPTEAVMNKAFEGMAKRAPEQAIVKAMEKTRARYAYSYGHARQFGLSKEKSKHIGNAMAECLAAGLTEKDMDRVMTQLRRRIQTTRQVEEDQNLVEQSVFAARTMARMGVVSNDVGEVVCQALSHQYNAQDMSTLQNRFREQARTRSAAMLANTYANSISQGMGSKSLGLSSDTGSGGHGNGPGSNGNSGGTSGGGSGGSGSGSGGGNGGSGSGNGGGGHGR